MGQLPNEYGTPNLNFEPLNNLQCVNSISRILRKATNSSQQAIKSGIVFNMTVE